MKIHPNKEKKNLMDMYIRNVNIIEDAFNQIQQHTGFINQQNQEVYQTVLLETGQPQQVPLQQMSGIQLTQASQEQQLNQESYLQNYANNNNDCMNNMAALVIQESNAGAGGAEMAQVPGMQPGQEAAAQIDRGANAANIENGT